MGVPPVAHDYHYIPQFKKVTFSIQVKLTNEDLAGGGGERREGIIGSTSTAAAEQMQEGQDDGGSCAGKFISDIITTNILQRLLCV